MGFFEKLKQGLRKTADNIGSAIGGTFSGAVDDELLDELEEILILSDMGVSTSRKICSELRARAKKAHIGSREELARELSAIIEGMMAPEREMNFEQKPTVLLVIGVNGAGKTTSIGKMAHYYSAQGKKVMLAAADTFRAAAIDQLEVWAERSGCPMIRHAEGADPAAVVYDAAKAARARGIDVLICDTAGRLHNKKNLMDELGKIARVAEKESGGAVETLLVVDGSTGQNALSQARLFSAAAPITGLVLTKIDGTAKGGAVVAIKEELGLPVRFIGVGEGIDDLEPFDPAQFASAFWSGVGAS